MVDCGATAVAKQGGFASANTRLANSGYSIAPKCLQPAPLLALAPIRPFFFFSRNSLFHTAIFLQVLLVITYYLIPNVVCSLLGFQTLGGSMSTVKRISLSVPVDLARDLDYVHRRIGVSKSALVSLLLSEGLSDVRALLESIPDDPSPDDILRFRGASAELASARVNHFKSQLGS